MSWYAFSIKLLLNTLSHGEIGGKEGLRVQGHLI